VNRPPGLHGWFIHQRGTVRLPHETRLAVLWAARGLGAFALAVFFILAAQERVPRSVLQEDWEPTVQYGALGLVAAGYAIALRWEGIGGAILLVGSIVLGILATLAYHPGVALFGCLAFFVPGALFVLYWQHHHRPVVLASVVAGMGTLLVAGGIGATAVYDHYLGPTHPNSTAARIPVDIAEWVISGGVTIDGFTVKAQLGDPAKGAGELVVAAVDGTGAAQTFPAAAGPSPDGDVATYVVTGMRPGTRYSYAIRRDGHTDEGRRGEVTTLPAGTASFTIAFASCARVGSNGRVFDAIRAAQPLLYIVTGDFHYQNVTTDSPVVIRAAYDLALEAPGQEALYLAAPIVYTWDDHDFGGDGSDRTSAARGAAQAVYRDYFPHYELPAGADSGAIYQAFTIGRVRFIVTDGRSERDPAADPDGPEKSLLGAEQKEWLKAELLAARDSSALIVWVSSVPWIAQPAPGADHWGNYAAERRELSDFMVANSITNLVMLSGDAHMLAADDGSNNVFASDGAGPAFPVFHAAALDRPGAVKGGPYSEGAYPGGGQFGLLTVTDAGGSVTVRFSGRTWEDEELVSHEFTVPVANSAASR
jgi:phosphodiesterase/alkaline phosphatase D-like protein